MAAAVGLLLVIGVLLVAGVSGARADTAPADPAGLADPVTVSADALPTVQINGVVWAQIVVGNTVFAAGQFTSARPAGSPAGSNETPRNNLLAYDIQTGNLITSFAPNLNGQARALAASPDGSTLYVGGDFTTANGLPHKRLAAYNVATGQLIDSWKPSINGTVRAVAATNSAVYFGGTFSAVGGIARTNLAAVTSPAAAPAVGLLNWSPVPNIGPTSGNRSPGGGAPPSTATSNAVLAMVIPATGNEVVIGGRFNSLNGPVLSTSPTGSTGVGAVPLDDGTTTSGKTTLPFAIGGIIMNQGVNSAIYSLSLSPDGSAIFGTAYDYFGPGNIEGAFEVRPDGTTIAIDDCRGDTYSGFSSGSAFYVTGHPHNCGDSNSFPEQNPQVHKYGLATSTVPVGVAGPNGPGNKAFTGTPSVAVLNWWPSFQQGSFTGQFQAGWSVSGNSQYVVFGGEFPSVNGTAQQGLVRFAVPSIAPNKRWPATIGLVAPTGSALAGGGERLTWTTTSDQDNENLTYSVYRDGGTNPIGSVTATSQWWTTPPASFDDVSVGTGSHTYRVVASDAFGNKATYPDATVTVATAGPGLRPYSAVVRGDGAQQYWPLGDAVGSTTGADKAGGLDLRTTGSTTFGQAGAITGDTDKAVRTNGTTGYLTTRTAIPAPLVFSEEAWFKSTASSGKILGFGNATTASSGNYDRHLYLNLGKVNFGVYNGVTNIVTSPNTYNDGNYHHVVGTLSSAGMVLYIDGVQVATGPPLTATPQMYNGYWHVGADSTWAGSKFFNGTIDEVAIYPTALTGAQVAAHYAAGAGTPVPNQPPAANFTAAPTGLKVAFDATSSTDPDGSVASYAWDFGDGVGTSTQPKPSYTYAAPGTYPVKLTVTDDKGATNSSTQSITVSNAPPVAAFTATPSALTVAFDGSGSADSDGSIASYAWDFGDTGTDSVATPSHTYAAAGTYHVTLTVTDNLGATNQVAHDVTVSSAPTPFATDAFGRTQATGWGTADSGGAWTLSTPNSGSSSVANGVGQLGITKAGSSSTALQGSVSAQDLALQADISLDALPSNGATPPAGSAYTTFALRQVNASTLYQSQVRINAAGVVQLAFLKKFVSGGVTSNPQIGGTVTVSGLTYTPGAVLHVLTDVSGTSPTTLRAMLWLDGTPMPTTWQNTQTDSEVTLQAPGAIGVGQYVGSSALNVPIRLSVDNWWAGPAGTHP